MFIQLEKQLISKKKKNWKKLKVKSATWGEDKPWRRCNVNEKYIIPKEKDDGKDVASNRT